MKTISIKEKFEELAEGIISEAETFNFNLKDLPEIANFSNDIRKAKVFEEIYNQLDLKVNSCLYWFELENIEIGKELQRLLDSQRIDLANRSRTVPARNNNKDSHVLYVGIRRGGLTKKYQMSHISGRISVHLGYYHKGSTQGLQLAHWAKDFDCNVKLRVIQFEDLPNDYLNTLEKIIAYKLKPLCGKH